LRVIPACSRRYLTRNCAGVATGGCGNLQLALCFSFGNSLLCIVRSATNASAPPSGRSDHNRRRIQTLPQRMPVRPRSQNNLGVLGMRSASSQSKHSSIRVCGSRGITRTVPRVCSRKAMLGLLHDGRPTRAIATGAVLLSRRRRVIAPRQKRSSISRGVRVMGPSSRGSNKAGGRRRRATFTLSPAAT